MILTARCRVHMTSDTQSGATQNTVDGATHISARLADMARLPKKETMRPQTTAVGPPEGKAMDSEVAMAVHEFRIAYARPTTDISYTVICVSNQGNHLPNTHSD